MSAGSEEPSNPRGRRGGRKNRKHGGPRPMKVPCPTCGQRPGHHCLRGAEGLPEQFHATRIQLAEQKRGGRVLTSKRAGDTKRLMRRTDFRRPDRKSADDEVSYS